MDILQWAENYWRAEFDQRLLPAYLANWKHCSYCGATVYDLSLHQQFTGEIIPDRLEATTDHVIPTSLGGADTPKNKVIACRGCNSRKGNQIWKPKL